MATLTIPHSFTAGTPALASEVNANFQAIVNWTQSNISTDNFGILTARSVALPSAPTLAILSLSQSASQPVISISNQGTDNPISINQSGVFATGKGAIVINDPTAQTISGAAHLLMSLSSASTVPAIKIDHGTTTMSLTKTQLDLFNGAVQATSAGVVSMTTANLTTVAATDVNTTNVTATGLLDLTAPASDAIVAEIKGRSSDNNAIVQFKSNDDATVYASATSSDSGLTLNLPDTADSYTFKVNDVTKAVIDDNGVDAQYLYGTLPSALQASEILVTTPPITASNSIFATSSGTQVITIYTGSFSISSQKLVTADIISGSITGAVFGSGTSFGSLDLRITGPIRTNTVVVTSAVSTTSATPVSNLTVSVNPMILPAGTYSYSIVSTMNYTIVLNPANRRVDNTNIVAQIYAT